MFVMLNTDPLGKRIDRIRIVYSEFIKIENQVIRSKVLDRLIHEDSYLLNFLFYVTSDERHMGTLLDSFGDTTSNAYYRCDGSVLLSQLLHLIKDMTYEFLSFLKMNGLFSGHKGLFSTGIGDKIFSIHQLDLSNNLLILRLHERELTWKPLLTKK